VAMTSGRTLAAKFDRRALREGAMVCVLFAVPATIIARVFFDDKAGSGWSGLLSFIAFVGFVIGAGQAAWRQQLGTPLTHGILTTVGVYLIVQGAIVIGKAIAGSDIHWIRIIFGISLTLFAGFVGGMLGSSMNKTGLRPRS
jgi:hypothetical protein